MPFLFRELLSLVSMALLQGQQMSTKTGLPFWPAFAGTFLLLLIIYIFSKISNKKKAMTNIQRTVNGDPTDPSSTRDLTGIIPRELGHLKLCLISAIKEAQAFQRMDDDQLPLLIAQANTISEQYGLPTVDASTSSPDELREYFCDREVNQAGLLEKFRAVEDAPEMAVIGITPPEYMHLVTSVQAGLRESIIYATLSQEEIEEGIATINAILNGWGISPWDHYNQWKERWPDFFAGRIVLLSDIIEAINQPYPGCEYDDRIIEKIVSDSMD
jgi:hypothetical protein